MDQSHLLIFLLLPTPTRLPLPLADSMHPRTEELLAGAVGTPCISGAPMHQDKAFTGLPPTCVPPTALLHQQSHPLQAGGDVRSSEAS